MCPGVPLEMAQAVAETILCLVSMLGALIGLLAAWR
jgi:hypothetical protein